MNMIVAVVGMCGSGKSAVCDVFRERDWQYIRFGQLVIDRLREEGREINPSNERQMREGLRKEHGMGAFALLLLPGIESALSEGNVVIDGLYSWSEYKILKERFTARFKVLSVYASPKTRYRRLESRTGGKDDRDHRMRMLTAEEARQRDYAEIEYIEKGGPIAMADYTLLNEGSLGSLTGAAEELAARLECE
jgi:dephospho-CoA kinase